MDPREGSDAGGAPGATSRRSAGNQDPPTVVLVRGIIDDAKNLFRQEVQLAKQEVTEGLTQGAKAGSILAAAGVIGLFMFGFLWATIAWALVAAGLPRWAGFGIVTLILLIIAAVLGLIGQQQMKKTQVSPARAQTQFNQAKQQLQSDAQTAATGIQAELRAEAQEAQTEVKKVPGRFRTNTAAYLKQTRATLRQRAETAQQRQLGSPGGGSPASAGESSEPSTRPSGG